MLQWCTCFLAFELTEVSDGFQVVEMTGFELTGTSVISSLNN